MLSECTWKKNPNSICTSATRKFIIQFLEKSHLFLFTNFRFETLSVLTVSVQAQNTDFFFGLINTLLWLFPALWCTHTENSTEFILKTKKKYYQMKKKIFSFDLNHWFKGYESKLILNYSQSKHVKWHTHTHAIHFDGLRVFVLCIAKSLW